MVIQTGDNKFGVSKWIVDPTLGLGTHTTITAATASASSGDNIFIRPGTYTEDFTAKAGVTYTTFSGNAQEPTVTIVGKITYTSAGTVTFSNMLLQTNSDFFLVVSGSAASVVNFKSCNFNCSNNTGISYTSSGGGTVTCYECIGDLGTTGIAYFANTAGNTQFFNCTFSNTGASLTANTFSGATINIINSRFLNGLTTSGSTATGNINNSIVGNFNLNATSLTHNSTSASALSAVDSVFSGGSSSAISVGAGAIFIADGCTVSSQNTNAITGSGTIRYTPISFTGNSSTINTSTATRQAFGPNAYIPTGVTFDNTNVLQNYVTSTSFTPTLTGASTAGSTTYSAQNGSYIRVGNLVTVYVNVVGSAATGTGNALIGNLPFTVKNSGTYNPVGTFSCANAAGWTWPASTTHVAVQALQNTTTAQISCSGTGAAAGALQMANAAFNMTIGLTYEI